MGPPTTMGGRLTKVKGRCLLDIVVGDGATILKLFADEDQALPVGRYVLVLNFGVISRA